MTQTWWLSFADSARPSGEQFAGVAIVDVTEADMLAAVPWVLERRMGSGAPPPTDEAVYWLGAAIRKSWQAGCNPGGEVASWRIDDRPDFARLGPRYPRHVLLTKAQVELIDADLDKADTK